jgi:ADP-glucose pyrophosphorylase
MGAENVPAIILADGVGQRLFPRNKQHANPAILLDGPYAPIDSGLSNTIDAGIQKILVIA